MHALHLARLSRVRGRSQRLGLAFLLAASVAPDAPAPASYRLVNGRWYDGTGFVARTMTVVGGVLRVGEQGAADSVIDLRGKFVIPPLADAHTHHFGLPFSLTNDAELYVQKGIFYAKNDHGVLPFSAEARRALRALGTVDVAYAHAGITSSGGHPVQIFEHLAGQRVLGTFTKDSLPDRAYFTVDAASDLERAWPKVLASRPDFVKIYLEHSEEYAKRKSDSTYFGRRGLDPSIVSAIVQRAHASRLRVAAHVNTPSDFRAAIDAGVDEVTHLPLGRVTEEDARRAAARGTVIVTTVRSHRPTEGLTDVDAIHRDNLRLLFRAGARLAIGTDDNAITVVDELTTLRSLSAFPDSALLRLAVEETPRAIFPDRRIGRLDDGFEANLLVLDGNPLEHYANLGRIALRMKGGRLVGTAAAR